MLCSLPLTTLREFTMLHLMDILTDKPGWEEKVTMTSRVDPQSHPFTRSMLLFWLAALLLC